MNFTITKNELFFRKATPEYLLKLEDKISKICYENLESKYGQSEQAKKRLDVELRYMIESGSAYHFAILKVISDLSTEEGYPIVVEGCISGSIILYLLGVVNIDPLNNGVIKTFSEMIWEDDSQIVFPCFDTEIAEPVRSKIKKRLNDKFSNIKCDKNLYFRIFLPRNETCKMIGKLRKATIIKSKPENYSGEIYLETIKKISEDNLSALDDMRAEKNISEEAYLKGCNFANKLKKVTSCDFTALTRIYGYNYASFNSEKSLQKLKSNNFYVLREELYSVLLDYGVHKNDAIKIVKHGVWSTKSFKQEYVDLLKEYNVPEFIIEYFNDAKNLWDVSACINRLEILCELMWYKTNYPNEFLKITSKDDANIKKARIR